MAKTVIGVLVGSARRESFSKKVAQSLITMMPERFDMRLLAIDHLPLFNQDYDDDGNVPETWVAFRRQVQQAHGFLFVTPEYNRATPPILKNAVDIASRPRGQNQWGKKPGAVLSVSPGGYGGFGANHQLRQPLMCLNVYLMQQPEAYVGHIEDALDENGGLTGEKTLAFLQKVAASFAAWADRFPPQP